jgi:hypothetical protein
MDGGTIMTKDYHEKKLEEQRKAEAAALMATIDYNIMIGNLEDPQEAPNE